MIGLGNLLGDGGPSEPRCSRAGCDAPATTSVNWRNPKIHAADRVKVWLACDDHSEYLSEFLAARNFPVVTTLLGETVTNVPDPAPSGSGPTVHTRTSDPAITPA